MKKDIYEFCLRAKTKTSKYEHQRPARLLQKMLIPKWIWERIATDFVVGLPKTFVIFNSIWAVD